LCNNRPISIGIGLISTDKGLELVVGFCYNKGIMRRRNFMLGLI
jgi:hypothetical protein